MNLVADGIPRHCSAAVVALLTVVACDRAQVLVARALASVHSVEVNPVTATVVVGQAVQLTALPRDAGRRPLPGREVRWSSADPLIATVDDSGLVTTLAAGEAAITATSDGSSGTSTVTVTSERVPPTNEPTGLTLINEQTWNCLACNGWSYRADDGWVDIRTDPMAPQSPASVLRVAFPTSMPRDQGPGNQWLVLARPHRWRELYVAYWIKWGDPWDALEQGAKIAFFWTQSGTYLYALQVPGVPPYHIGMVVGWSPYGYGHGDRGVWHPNVTTTPVVTGQWYLVEEYFKYPSAPGGSDGVMRWWVNGALNGDYTNVTYPADGGFVQFEFPLTRQATPLVTSYVYLDHARVSGRP